MNKIIEDLIFEVLIPLIIVGVLMLIVVIIVALLALCGVNLND
jgi:hypothetical protein